ncbi:hypothetical protein [Streptomyces sp. NPDC051001]|uniref:hypothetical protein n=1 Tax=Streptomyces sp. NPDC051001 TaxID=3155795 RepID=UPI0034217717
MRLRWDWLRLVQAPYVPTIGPGHQSVLTEALFTDTLIADCTDRWFLRCDKNIRWFDSKDETVLMAGTGSQTANCRKPRRRPLIRLTRWRT